MSETPQPYRVHDAAKLRALIVNGQGISPALATDLVDHIAALEAENARLQTALDIASDGLEAGDEHLHIADKEINALQVENIWLRDERNAAQAENARMRVVVEAVAEAGVGDEYGGGSWLMFAGYDAETVRQQARAILAAHPPQEAPPTP